MKIEDVIKTIDILNECETKVHAAKKLGITRAAIEWRINNWPIEKKKKGENVTRTYTQTWFKAKWEYSLRRG